MTDNSNISLVEFKAYVSEIENINWQGDDVIVSNLFLDVFSHSSEFWESYSNNNKAMSDKDKQKAVIIADALGALHGSIFGPWGSIIEEAVASCIAVDELY